jgi:peptidoglycan/LPS O-acetylase OafA/YrhL
MKSASGMAYRADVDGLRAVAVLPVIFFHAGVDLFSGGFVGVDVFFVVSGYLITSIILTEIRAGTFTYLGFYERRVRRIFPALFLMTGVSLPLGLFVLVPEHLEDFGQSVIAAALFVSNFFFYLEDGYFEGPADLHPLLHTWSLAVEEQFYLLVPLLLMLLVRRRLPVVGVLLLLAGLSFGFSVWQLERNPSAAFYLLPARFWELMLGAALAAAALPAFRSRALAAVGTAIGLAAIAAAVLLFDEATKFPGAAALLPCLGTALVIHAGRTANPLSALLGSEPLRRVGLLSYSLYLWHFPLMVFTRHLIIRPFTGTEIAGLVMLTFILAALSWRYVEQPFRARSSAGEPFVQRRALFRLAALVMLLAVGFGLFTDLGDGAPGRFGTQARAYLAANDDRDTSCLRKGEHCELGDPNRPASFIVWGDSHAGAMLPPFRELSERFGVTGAAWLRGGCLPSVGYRSTTSVIAESCAAANQAALTAALQPGIEAVFIAGRWTMMVEQSMFGFESGQPHGMLDESGELAGAHSREVLEKVLGNTLASLQAGGKTVYILGPVPEAGFHVPHVLAQRSRFAELLAADTIGPTRIQFDERNRRTLALLSRLAEEHQATLLLPHETFCAGERCVITRDRTPLYYDTDHLTITGALELVPLLETPIREIAQ